MIHDPVAAWRELSALYEQADLLAGSALGEWLAVLPAEMQQHVPRLERMLAARTRAAAEQFLESMPLLHEVAEEPSLMAWGAGRCVGPYRLVRHVGSGGMAEVWLAERDDGAFARTVAIKLLHNRPTRAEHETFVERFRRERDILASLDHPNIAGLHDAGVTPEGQPWLALEYVEGKTITAWCDNERLTIEERVKLFRQVLLAVEHAHARLVIHRDVKPSNVLVTSAGEVRLLDFGIAKLLEAEGAAHIATALTAESGRPLTPQYASPEQMLGEPLTTACDVYSLGVVLYELLAGEAPYDLAGKSLAEVEAVVVTVDPLLPSRRSCPASCLAARRTDAKGLRGELKPDLDAIVMRALEKAVARRYQSVGAMRAELDRWLANEPVLATLPSPGYRAGKFIRRHRTGVGAGAAVACLLVLAATVVAWQSVRAQHEASRALASKDFLLDMFREADPNSTRGDGVLAAQLLDAGLQRANQQLVGQPELRAEVLKGIVEIDQHLNRYAKAQTALEQVVEIYASLGMRRERLAAQIELADNAWRMDDPLLASLLLERAAPEISAFSDDERLQARQHEVKGWLARTMGDLAGAKAHMLASWKSATSAYGGNDNRTADAVRGLAGVESELREYEAAMLHIKEARSIAAASTNATPTDLVSLEIEQAQIAFDAGRLAEAKPMMDAAIAHCDSALGEDNENCFYMRAFDAELLVRIGGFQQALEFLPSILRETSNDLSPRRQAEAVVLASRLLAANGRLVNDQGLRDRLLKLAYESSDQQFSKDLRRSARLAVAEIALREGRIADVEPALRVLVDDLANEPDDSYLAKVLLLRGLALQSAGRDEEALRSLRAADIKYVAWLGSEHSVTLMYRLNQVPSLVRTGSRAKAEMLMNSTLPKLREGLPRGAPIVTKVETYEKGLRASGARPIDPNFERTVFFN